MIISISGPPVQPIFGCMCDKNPGALRKQPPGELLQSGNQRKRYKTATKCVLSQFQDVFLPHAWTPVPTVVERKHSFLLQWIMTLFPVTHFHFLVTWLLERLFPTSVAMLPSSQISAAFITKHKNLPPKAEINRIYPLILFFPSIYKIVRPWCKLSAINFFHLGHSQGNTVRQTGREREGISCHFQFTWWGC